MTNKEFPILMADVIKSRLHNSVELQNCLRKTVEEVNQRFSKHILSPLTITLGDEFQGIIKSIPYSLFIIIFIEEFIKGNNFNLKLRYVVFEGTIDTEINSKIAYEMLGDGLAMARSELISLKKEKFTRIKIFINNYRIRFLLEILLHQILINVDKWNEKDAKILREYYSNLIELKLNQENIYRDNYKLIASNLEKDPSLIWRRLHSLGLRNMENLKEAIRILFRK